MQNFTFLLIATLCVFQSFGDVLIEADTPTFSGSTSLNGHTLVRLGENDYYFESDETRKANWFSALNYCRRNGMDLVDITSKEENDNIKDHITSLGLQKDWWWTSGNDLGNEGTFSWATTGQEITFSDWHADEPTNLYNNEHCIEFWFRNGVMKWNDIHCSRKSYFICKKNLIIHNHVNDIDVRVNTQF